MDASFDPSQNVAVFTARPLLIACFLIRCHAIGTPSFPPRFKRSHTPRQALMFYKEQTVPTSHNLPGRAPGLERPAADRYTTVV